MSRVLALLFLMSIAWGCGPDRAMVGDPAALHRAPLYTFNEREVDAYLRLLQEETPSPADRVVRLARKNLGQPYRIFLLGEHPFELHDPDPMYCLSASDCVTFVEQTYAMALSSDWPSFFRTLQRIRYQDGRVGILTRNHFIEADWNVHNAWLFEDLTARLDDAGVHPMHTRIDRAAFFAGFGITVDTPVELLEDVYLPRSRLPEVADRLQDGDVIQIIRGNDRWQYVSHVGLITHDRNARPAILHSTSPAVREEPLGAYLDKHPDILGLKVLRMVKSGSDESRGAGVPPVDSRGAGVPPVGAPTGSGAPATPDGRDARTTQTRTTQIGSRQP